MRILYSYGSRVVSGARGALNTVVRKKQAMQAHHTLSALLMDQRIQYRIRSGIPPGRAVGLELLERTLAGIYRLVKRFQK